MQHLEVSGAVRPLYGPLGVKGLNWYDVITRQNHFNTNNEILIQRKRLATGKPTSGLITEFFQQNLQHPHLTHPSNKHQIINYIRYVDNILLIFDSNHTNIQNILMTSMQYTPIRNSQQKQKPTTAPTT
jgi:hypothetical protein